MAKRIIDNKELELTDSEFKLYNEIVESYNKDRFNGADLFKGLFETDKNGIIIFLKPPNKTHASLEVYLFLVSIMVHQHLRISTTSFDIMLKDMINTNNEAKELIKELKNLKESNK